PVTFLPTLRAVCFSDGNIAIRPHWPTCRMVATTRKQMATKRPFFAAPRYRTKAQSDGYYGGNQEAFLNHGPEQTRRFDCFAYCQLPICDGHGSAFPAMNSQMGPMSN